MRRLISWLLISFFLLLTWQPVSAQTSIQVTDVQAQSTFGSEISFSAHVQSPSLIKEVFIFFQVEGETDPRGSLLTIGDNGQLNFSYDLSQDPIRPFASITYWYTFNLLNGEAFTTPTYEFQYIDNRFSWQTLLSGNVEVNWVTGDVEFGRQVSDVVLQSILRIGDSFSISMNKPVRVYIYASPTDLQDALTLGRLSSVSPELEVILVSISPGFDQIDRMEHLLPHELVQLLLFRKTGESYSHLPAWLIEGLVTRSELSPNPSYPSILQDANAHKTLLPLLSLCADFPQEAASNLQAYAQADSFTAYLLLKYGQKGLDSLIQSYALGVDCDQSPLSSLGKPLTQLERDWLQATFNKNAVTQAITTFLPYLFILLLILMIPLLNKPKTIPKKRG
jgi:hypothetical protein